MYNTMKTPKIVIVAAILVFFVSSVGFASSALRYAALPPFLTTDVKPNVLLVMDYSGSMQAQAYYPTTWHGYYGHALPGDSLVGNFGNEDENSQDYDENIDYYGYFDSQAYYSYNESGEYWYIDEDTPFSEDDLGHVDDDSLSGNLLNYLVTSRMDGALKSLIGGKGNCPEDEDYCILEPQGAKRYISVNNVRITAHIRPENYSSGNYLDKRMLISIERLRGSDESSAIGTFAAPRYASVKIDAEDRSGIVQNNFHKVRFAFIPYANDINDTAKEGKIRYGVDQQDMDLLISEIENTLPYWATHTGEAMEEAYNYLRQDGMYAYNSDYEGKETAVDPYYEQREIVTVTEEDGELVTEIEDGELESAWCRDSFVVLISDGVWNGEEDPAKWAYKLFTEDLRPNLLDPQGNQFDHNAEVYTIFAFTEEIGGLNSMQATAAFGNFDEMDGCPVGPFGLNIDDDSRDVSFPVDECDPEGTYDECCRQWDKTENGIPDAFFDARDGQQMETALEEIFGSIRHGTSAGTSITTLSEEVDTGSVMSQAVFYPQKQFDEHKIVSWTGNIFGTWYLNTEIDGNLVQNIREDTNSNYKLDVEHDRILEYEIDELGDALQIHAYDSDIDGTKADESPSETYLNLEDVATLFDAGSMLKDRDQSKRRIFGVDEDNTLKAFTTGNVNSFVSMLGDDVDEYHACLLDSSNNTPDHNKLIRWVRGAREEGCRVRDAGRVQDADGSKNVWKLGDIIHSTPTVVNYGLYRLIFAGSNSGMLHAFRLGYIGNLRDELQPAALWNTQYDSDVDELGVEEWAFIPKAAMPYLRYKADPNYDHMYTVDMEPYIIDTRERTVLIGGMRLGGAVADCSVNPPADTDPVGLSSYFALDISDPLNPEFLWEFTDDGLGFSFSGPAYIKREDVNGELQHYVLFASGPTNYDGTSTQPLTFYLLDLETGEKIEGHEINRLNINNAFGGRLFTDGLDRNKDGQTDFVFIGYSDDSSGRASERGEYHQMTGGVIKIHTGNADPGQWRAEGIFQSVGKAVTGAIKAMDCFPGVNPYPYLVFGTGRYFVPYDLTQPHNLTHQVDNHLYGVPFTCEADNTGCSTINQINNASDLNCEDILSAHSEQAAESASWKIPLKSNHGDFLSERSYTEPVTTNRNIVFFNTGMPTDVVCGLGGESNAYAINCSTGHGLDYDICADVDADYMIDPDLDFKFITQLSGGDVHQADRDAFDGDSGSLEETTKGMVGGPGVGSFYNPGKTQYWKQW